MKYLNENAVAPAAVVFASMVTGFVQETASTVEALPEWVKLAVGPFSGIVVLLIGWYAMAKYIKQKDTRMDAIMDDYIKHLKETHKTP